MVSTVIASGPATVHAATARPGGRSGAGRRAGGGVAAARRRCGRRPRSCWWSACCAASSPCCRTTTARPSAIRRGYELRLAFYEKIQRLSFCFHDKVHTGDLITLGMLDIDGVRMFFATGLVRVVLLGVLIGVGAYLLISTDLVLGLLSLSFVPFVAWRSSVTQLQLRATWLTLQERLSVLRRVMEENLGGIRVVRAFAAQEHRAGQVRPRPPGALEARARARRHPRQQHQRHELLVLRRHGPRALGRRRQGASPARSASARSPRSSPS